MSNKNKILELKRILLKGKIMMSLQREDETYQGALKKHHNDKRKIKKDIANLRRSNE